MCVTVSNSDFLQISRIANHKLFLTIFFICGYQVETDKKMDIFSRGMYIDCYPANLFRVCMEWKLACSGYPKTAPFPSPVLQPPPQIVTGDSTFFGFTKMEVFDKWGQQFAWWLFYSAPLPLTVVVGSLWSGPDGGGAGSFATGTGAAIAWPQCLSKWSLGICGLRQHNPAACWSSGIGEHSLTLCGVFFVGIFRLPRKLCLLVYLKETHTHRRCRRWKESNG